MSPPVPQKTALSRASGLCGFSVCDIYLAGLQKGLVDLVSQKAVLWMKLSLSPLPVAAAVSTQAQASVGSNSQMRQSA